MAFIRIIPKHVIKDEDAVGAVKDLQDLIWCMVVFCDRHFFAFSAISGDFGRFRPFKVTMAKTAVTGMGACFV